MNFKNEGGRGVDRKAFAFSFTKAVGDDGAIEGYASTFGNVDQGEDIVAAGAFSAWVNQNGGKLVPMLYGHRTDKVCGVWTTFKEDSKGLFVTGKITLASPTGAEVHALAKDGAIGGLSIGYRTRSANYDQVTGIRTLLVLDLKEVSLTAFPMNEEATILRVKSDELTPRYVEAALRDAGLSRSEAKAIVAGGFKALPLRDAGGTEVMVDALASLREMRADFKPAART